MSRFQVGEAENPQPTDPQFDDEQAAIQHAEELHRKDKWNTTPHAVWDERDDLIHLWFQGQLYKPA